MAEDSFANGKNKFSMNYKGRNLHGTATEWYESGNKKIELKRSYKIEY